MPAAQATAGEFDVRLCRPFHALLARARSAVQQMAAGHRERTRGGPWDRGWQKGPWEWRGGSGGPWAGF